MDRITRLIDELKAHLKGAQDIAAKAEAESRDFTEEERAQVTALMGKARDSKTALEQAKADQQMRRAIQEMGEGIGVVDPEEKTTRRTPSGLIDPSAGAKSLGEQFVDSDAYSGLLASAPNGQFGEKMRVQSAPVGFKSLTRPAPRQKALVTGTADDSAGALIESDRLGLQVGLDALTRPLTLRDVVTNGQTTSDTIEYPKLLSITNNAAPVPEATATTGTSGTKPESGFATTRATAVVRTIAHWIPATKRALSDAAQIKTLIDAFLFYGLDEELEDQMVSGDGTGENFTGILNTSGTQSQAAVADPAGKPPGFGKLLALRRAKTKVRLAGRAVANAYVLNPLDAETLDEISDNDGRFYFGGPAGSNVTGTLWGLPVILCEGIPQGTGVIGDWRKAILWDREQASITVTDSHADFFVRNLIAILAEMRAAFGILQPNAFVEVNLGAAA
ncbi:phage major capsid protein [Pseudonocardia acaciae]|uniref:phage major capsid protein n=1 Tax=Pseudonocardia acaciae TaxID=551276 RepID=UPI000687ECEA|nr:phage major capsid protein [Pseudonocardia acaciae]